MHQDVFGPDAGSFPALLCSLSFITGEFCQTASLYSVSCGISRAHIALQTDETPSGSGSGSGGSNRPRRRQTLWSAESSAHNRLLLYGPADTAVIQPSHGGSGSSNSNSGSNNNGSDGSNGSSGTSSHGSHAFGWSKHGAGAATDGSRAATAGQPALLSLTVQIPSSILTDPTSATSPAVVYLSVAGIVGLVDPDMMQWLRYTPNIPEDILRAQRTASSINLLHQRLQSTLTSAPRPHTHRGGVRKPAMTPAKAAAAAFSSSLQKMTKVASQQDVQAAWAARWRIFEDSIIQVDISHIVGVVSVDALPLYVNADGSKFLVPLFSSAAAALRRKQEFSNNSYGQDSSNNTAKLPNNGAVLESTDVISGIEDMLSALDAPGELVFVKLPSVELRPSSSTTLIPASHQIPLKLDRAQKSTLPWSLRFASASIFSVVLRENNVNTSSSSNNNNNNNSNNSDSSYSYDNRSECLVSRSFEPILELDVVDAMLVESLSPSAAAAAPTAAAQKSNEVSVCGHVNFSPVRLFFTRQQIEFFHTFSTLMSEKGAFLMGPSKAGVWPSVATDEASGAADPGLLDNAENMSSAAAAAATANERDGAHSMAAEVSSERGDVESIFSSDTGVSSMYTDDSKSDLSSATAAAAAAAAASSGIGSSMSSWPILLNFWIQVTLPKVELKVFYANTSHIHPAQKVILELEDISASFDMQRAVLRSQFKLGNVCVLHNILNAADYKAGSRTSCDSCNVLCPSFRLTCTQRHRQKNLHTRAQTHTHTLTHSHTLTHTHTLVFIFKRLPFSPHLLTSHRTLAWQC